MSTDPSRVRPPPPLRESYHRFTTITPRFNDVDVFGHVNNAEYYGYFDTAVMRVMTDSQVISMTGGTLGAVVAETGCRYHREVTFGDSITVGLRVATIGNSSVRYDVALFTNSDQAAAADGFFVHVFIDRSTKRPVRIPDAARVLLASMAVPAPR